MRKYKVLQLGLQLGFPVAKKFAIHGIYTTLNANKQVVAIATDTLCCIQYRIYDATHLHVTSLQLIFT
jgi:hypothetical protein